MMNTLIFLDPSYNEALGHYTREGSFLKKAAHKAGVDILHYVSTEVSDEASLKNSLVRRFSYKGFVDKLEDSIDAVSDFYNKLNSILLEIDDREARRCTGLLMYTGHPIHLPIIADLINRHRHRFPKLVAHVCIFYLDNEFCLGNSSEEYAEFLRNVSALVETSDPRGSLKISADSPRTIQVYGPFFKRPINRLPFPIESSGNALQWKRQPGKIRVLYVGASFQRSGYGLMYQTYKNFARRNALFEEFEFIVKHTRAGQLRETYDQFVKETWNITHITEFLDDDALDRLYSRCDVVILPYSKKDYPCQTSGVFVEALDKGKIVIVPNDTWLSDQVRELGFGEIFESDNPSDLERAIEKVVRDFDRYRSIRPFSLEGFRRYHSADNLLESLLENGAVLPIDPNTSEFRSLKDSLQMVLSATPKSWDIKHRIALIKKSTTIGDFVSAEAELEAVIGSDAVSNNAKCSLLVFVGQQYFACGFFLKAKIHFEHAIRCQKEDCSDALRMVQAKISICRGKESVDRGEYDTARSLYEEALRFNPNDPDADNELAALYLRLKKYKESAIHFGRVFKQFPHNRKACFGLAEAMSATGNEDYAIKIYRSFLTTHPNDEEAMDLLWLAEAAFSNAASPPLESQSTTVSVENSPSLSNKTYVGSFDKTGRSVFNPKALRFSVITPSFNQARFLKECLDSVSGQTHGPFEHLVFDPGSTDESRNIAAAHPGVTLFAEPDEGQADAVSKGFERAKGDIIAWINSDDRYFDDRVFERVAERFAAADAPDIVYGRGIYTDENRKKLRDAYINKDPSSMSWRFHQEDGVLQPATFILRSSITKLGLPSRHLHFCMDYELWIRSVRAGLKWAYLDENLAEAGYYRDNKTYGLRQESYREICDMLMVQFGYVNAKWLRRYAEFLQEGWDGILSSPQTASADNEEAVDREYAGLLRAYNTNADTWTLLRANADRKGYGDTLSEMVKWGITPTTPCRLVPAETRSEPGFVTYAADPKRRWAFASSWKQKQISKTHEFLREAIRERREDTCIIVGNGPSLATTPWKLLEGRDVIISNNAFLKKELLEVAKYFTVVNYLVAEQSCPHINRLGGIVKIIPYWLGYCIHEGPNTFFVDSVGYAEFSTDIFKNMSWRHTVSFFNLHLAYGLGYRRAILVGFDHSYRQSAEAKEADIICSDKKDDNHFDPRYFQNRKWQAADVTKMEEMYRLAKAAFEADGREIINATNGGHLELFRREPLDQCLNG